MDQWLANLADDRSDAPIADRIARARPTTLQEGCLTRDADPTFIAETQVLRPGRCEELYPSNPAPREVAGAGIASDIIKCQLEPVDEGDYPAPLTPQQRDRLHRIFADGVCDWSRPGVEQRRLAGTWLTF